MNRSFTLIPRRFALDQRAGVGHLRAAELEALAQGRRDRLGAAQAQRLCTTEAAIDAMSLAAIEGLRHDSLYVSTGGGWSPTTEAAIRAVAARPGTVLVAATDSNLQGDVFGNRLRAIAQDVGAGYDRLRPSRDDWNDDLKDALRTTR